MTGADTYRDRVEQLRNDDSACPVAAGFILTWNRDLPIADSERLIGPLLPRLHGSVGSRSLSERRSIMIADWLIRVYEPTWLLVAKPIDADALAALPEVTSAETLIAADDTVLQAIQRSAGDAARLTYWGNGLSIRDLAYRAALSAADTASPEDIERTVATLQASAVDLVHRMIEAR